MLHGPPFPALRLQLKKSSGLVVCRSCGTGRPAQSSGCREARPRGKKEGPTSGDRRVSPLSLLCPEGLHLLAYCPFYVRARGLAFCSRFSPFSGSSATFTPTCSDGYLLLRDLEKSWMVASCAMSHWCSCSLSTGGCPKGAEMCERSAISCRPSAAPVTFCACGFFCCPCSRSCGSGEDAGERGAGD